MLLNINPRVKVMIINHLGAVLGSIVATILQLLMHLIPNAYYGMSFLRQVKFEDVYYLILGTIIIAYFGKHLILSSMTYLKQTFVYFLQVCKKVFIFIIVGMFLYKNPWISSIVNVILTINQDTFTKLQLPPPYVILVVVFGIIVSLTWLFYSARYMVNYGNKLRGSDRHCCNCHSVDQLLKKIEANNQLMVAGIRQDITDDHESTRMINKRFRNGKPKRSLQPTEGHKPTIFQLDDSDDSAVYLDHTELEQIEQELTQDSQVTLSNTLPAENNSPPTSVIRSENKECDRCGLKHGPDRCWVLEKKIKCFKCKELGHVALRCKSGKNQVTLAFDETRRLTDIEKEMKRLQWELNALDKRRGRVAKKQDFRQSATPGQM